MSFTISLKNQFTNSINIWVCIYDGVLDAYVPSISQEIAQYGYSSDITINSQNSYVFVAYYNINYYGFFQMINTSDIVVKSSPFRVFFELENVQASTFYASTTQSSINVYNSNINSSVNTNTVCNAPYQTFGGADLNTAGTYPTPRTICVNILSIIQNLQFKNQYGQTLTLYMSLFDKNGNIIKGYTITIYNSYNMIIDYNGILEIVYVDSFGNYGIFQSVNMLQSDLDKKYQLVLNNSLANTLSTIPIANNFTNISYLSNNINTFISLPPCSTNFQPMGDINEDYVCLNSSIIKNFVITNQYGLDLILYISTYDNNNTNGFTVSLKQNESIANIIRNKIFIQIVFFDGNNYGIFPIINMNTTFKARYQLILTDTISSKVIVTPPKNLAFNLGYISNNINNYIAQPPCDTGYESIGDIEGNYICLKSYNLKNLTITNTYGIDLQLYVAIYDSSKLLITGFTITLNQNESVQYIQNKKCYIQIIYFDGTNYGLFSFLDMTKSNLLTRYQINLTNILSKNFLIQPNTDQDLGYISNNINSFVSIPPCADPNNDKVGDVNTNYICVNNKGIEKSFNSSSKSWIWITIICIVIVVVFIIIIVLVAYFLKRNKGKKKVE